MSWLTKTLTSSVGKKPIMAISGIFFSIFLMIHLGGNLTIYWGKEIFNNYTNHLHSLEIFINLFELVLVFFGIIHILTAISLFLGNRRARPLNYTIKTKASNRSLISTTMPYTGLIILIFVLFHLSNFHFTEKIYTTTFDMLQNVFSSSIYVCFYTLSILAVAIHISHGFWSAFQSMGLNHPKYIYLIKYSSFSTAIILATGFGFIPTYIMLLNH